MLNVILFLLIGLVAGWLAGQIMKGQGFGLVGNLVVGVAGSFLGFLIFLILGLFPHNIIGKLIAAVVGAVVLLWLVPRFLKK